jgi:hypothetical protein
MSLISDFLGTSERVLRHHYKHVTPDDLDALVAEPWTAEEPADPSVVSITSRA